MQRVLTRRALLPAVVVLAAIAAAVGIRGLGIHPVHIVTGSMTPAVETGDWIVVRDLHGDARDRVHRGDIVLFRYVGGRLRAIKRVVALAGERVTIRRRSYTIDSRAFGAVPTRDILGRSVLVAGSSARVLGGALALILAVALCAAGGRALVRRAGRRPGALV